jgi:hypothetical protein
MRRAGRFFVALALAIGLSVAGCASEVDEGDQGGDPSGATTGVGAGGDPLIEAPILKEVAPFSSVLRLLWETPVACDEVEGERRTAATSYEAVFTVPGTDTAFVDGEAYLDQTYTYRLRCKRGSSFSAYSNELTANPAGE